MVFLCRRSNFSGRVARFACALITFASFTFPLRALANDATPERCFETLDFLNGIISETTCPASQPQSSAAKFGLFNKKPAVVEWSKAFKGEGDLHRYLECYAVEDGRYDAIAKKYMPLIEKASRAFEVPKTVLACLIFRESRFDMKAVSPTGAIGLGQMLPSTMDHMTKLLKPVDQSFLARMKGILAKALPSGKEQAIKDRAYAKTIVKNSEFTASWEDYIGGLKSYYVKFNDSECRRRNPLNKKDPKKSEDARKKCLKRMNNDEHRTITVDNVTTDPAIAIGSTGLYLKTILKHFNETLKNAKVENGDEQSPNFYLLLAAVGSYNMGPGTAAEILKNVRPANAINWVEALKKSNEETAAHILSIQNCVEPASSKNNPWKGPIGSANHQCDAKNPSVLPGGANELPKQYQNKVKTASLSETELTPVKKADKPKTESKKNKTDTFAEKKRKERQT